MSARAIAVAACLLAAGGCGSGGRDEARSAAPAPASAEGSPPPAAPAAAPPAAGDGYLPLDASVVSPGDTLAALRARHGDMDVITAMVPGAEGEEFEGWVLFPDDPAREAYIYLDDAGRPASVRVIDDAGRSRWRREDGIHAGQTLQDLVARNGKPVRFLGFGWDYGGGIIGWNGGALERDPPLGGVSLCATCAADATDCGPSGDAEFDSDSPLVAGATITVCDFSVDLAPQASQDAEAP